MTFADFIEEIGIDTISGAMGIDRSRIYVWKCRGRIPRGEWPALLVALPSLKVDDLFAMDHASKRQA